MKSVLISLCVVGLLSWDITNALNSMIDYYCSYYIGRPKPLKPVRPTTVSIVRSDDANLGNPVPVTDTTIAYMTIEQMVRRSLDLIGGMRKYVKTGNTVLIKPNIVDIEPSGCGEVTDVRVIKALVKIADEIDHGKVKIIVGEGSPRPFTTFEKATGTTQRAWTQLFDVPGYQDLKTEMLAAGVDFRLSNLNGNSDTDPWPELQYVDVPGGGSAQPQGGKYFIHRDVLNADVYITVPVMKIHDPGITVALKNQIGIAPSSKYGFSKTAGVLQDNYQHKLSHLTQAPYNWTDKEIVDLCAIAKIKLNVVDALACLETKKDAVRDPYGKITNMVRMNTIIAGEDPVAVDHVCSRLMGLNPDDMEHVTLAERIGLGTNDEAKITVAGASIASTMKRFKKSQSASGLYGQSNRTWLLKGPFPIDTIADPMNYPFIPNEAAAAPAAGQDGWSPEVYFINDRNNLKDYYNLAAGSKVVSYSFVWFKASENVQAELWVGSDEAVKIYMNGTVVYNYTGTRSFPGTQYYSEKVTINVNKGQNRLLIKTLQKTGTFDYSVNICDYETDPLYQGNRIWGLKFMTDTNSSVSGITGADGKTKNFTLLNCYPNPFNCSARFIYSAASKENLSLRIYNTAGRLVYAFEKIPAGENEVTWNGKDAAGKTAPSGVYIASLYQNGQQVASRKICLLK